MEDLVVELVAAVAVVLFAWKTRKRQDRQTQRTRVLVECMLEQQRQLSAGGGVSIAGGSSGTVSKRCPSLVGEELQDLRQE